MTVPKLTTIAFHGASLIAMEGETPETTLVAMKPVSEGMNLTWQSQHRKLLGHPVLSGCIIKLMMQMPGDDQTREWVFLPLNRLNFWLATIHPNKVPDAETRAKVIEYQAECADALYQHFFAKAKRAAKARRFVDEKRTEELHYMKKVKTMVEFAREMRLQGGARYSAPLCGQLLKKLNLVPPDVVPEPLRQADIFDELEGSIEGRPN